MLIESLVGEPEIVLVTPVAGASLDIPCNPSSCTPNVACNPNIFCNPFNCAPALRPCAPDAMPCAPIKPPQPPPPGPPKPPSL